MSVNDKIDIENELLKRASVSISDCNFSDDLEQLKYEDEVLKPSILECFKYYNENFPMHPNAFISFVANLFHRIVCSIDTDSMEFSFLRNQADLENVLKDYSFVDKIINILARYLPYFRGSIDIGPLVEEFEYASNLIVPDDKRYFKWNYGIKKLSAHFADKLYMPLIFYYDRELDKIENIILKDVAEDSKKLYQSGMGNRISQIIFNYAKVWIHMPDNKFRVAVECLTKLSQFDSAKELIALEQEYVRVLESNGYPIKLDKRGKK